MGTVKQGAASGLAEAIARRPSTGALLLHRMPPASLVARTSTRFTTTTILCSASPRPCVNVASIHALEPDFYNIPYVDGVPVGKRLMLWNLPPNCKDSELLEWFAGVDVVVESLELTNNPALNAQGIGGFVEFATKQDACIAIIRLDGYKFRGHYIRMDFAERRPRPNYGSKRSKPNRNSSSRGNFKTSAVQSAEASPGTGTNAEAPSNGVVRQVISDVEGRSPTEAVPAIGQIPPPSSYSTHGNLNDRKLEPYDDPFSAPDQAMVEGRSPTATVSVIGETPPPSSCSSHGNLDDHPYNDPFKSCGAPDQAMMEGRSPTVAVSVIGQIPPPSSYASHGNRDDFKLDPYSDPFKSYGAPDQAVVEPWYNKISFRSGPMYGSPEPSSFNRLFVSNMALSVDDATLQQLFSRFGTVLEARVLRDLESGRSRGFGIVAMSSVQEAKAASRALDGWCLESHPLRVNAVAL